MASSACTTDRTTTATVWPPPDFGLVVEELRVRTDVGEQPQPALSRRLQVFADGTVLLLRARAVLVDADTGTLLPVFDEAAAWRMLPVTTRLLARKMHDRGITELRPTVVDLGAIPDGGSLLRLRYQGFGHEVAAVGCGPFQGSFARVLRVVNAFLAKDDAFESPGMAGDRELSKVTGVPSPQRDLAGSLRLHQDLLREHPADPELLLAAFALACGSGERTEAERLLARLAPQLPADPGPPVSLPAGTAPVLSAAILTRLLPPAEGQPAAAR